MNVLQRALSSSPLDEESEAVDSDGRLVMFGNKKRNHVGHGLPFTEMGLTLLGFGIAFGVLVVAIIMYGSGADTPEHKAVAVASLLAFGVAAACVGVATGFLFGIPKFKEDSDGGETIAYNTNLGQVSDWLTKVLLGATLTQLGRIGSGASSLFSSMASALSIPSASPAFVGSVVISGAVIGFLVGWLATATLLTDAMAEMKERARLRREEGREEGGEHAGVPAPA